MTKKTAKKNTAPKATPLKVVESTIGNKAPVVPVGTRVKEVDQRPEASAPTLVQRNLDAGHLQKHYRAMLLKLVIVKVGKNVLQGDPNSKALLNDAIQAVETLGEKGTEWITANDEIVKLSLAQLKEAHAKAMVAISGIYLKSKAGKLTADDVRDAEAAYDKATSV